MGEIFGFKSWRKAVQFAHSAQGNRRAAAENPGLRLMIQFLKKRMEKLREPQPASALGPLETSIMEILWACRECNVRDVVDQLDRRLAYTTVMTTLDRLFKKGLLHRNKVDRSFVYLPKYSREQWEQKRAGELVAGFLGGPEPFRDLFLSSFLDVVTEHDPALLDQLERKIRARRKDLVGRRES
jgi:predicted transcriptional regulator